MKKIMPFLAFLLAHFPSFAAMAQNPNVDDVLKRADDIRNPAESFLMTVEVRDSNSRSLFEVSTGGRDKTFVRTKEPARDKGRNLLMLGDDMWIYIPNMKRAVRVGMNQRLSGQAANGDISRMRWHGDYQAVLEKETAQEWSLNLSANRKGLTYDRIAVTIDKATGRPLRADYQTMLGKALKHASFGDYRMDAGAVRPHEIVIQDAIRPKETSTVRILSFQVKSFPATTFHQAALGE